MSSPWPEPVERVAAFLRAASTEATLEEFATDTPTAEAAADAAGCALAQIVKSLVLMCDDAPVVALVPGNRRGDAVKIAQLSGASKGRFAKPDEVRRATGFAPGGVGPFGLPGGIRILVERTLLSHSVVWVGAGSDRHMVSVTPAELMRLTRGEAVDLVQESA